MKTPNTIRYLFAFPGFTAKSNLVGMFGDRYARVIQLKRRKKQPPVLAVVTGAEDVTTRRLYGYVISQLQGGGSTWSSNAGVSVVRGAMVCM